MNLWQKTMMSYRKFKKYIGTVVVLIAAVITVYNYFSEKTPKAKVETLSEATDDFVEFIDVGQGDCTLISSNGLNCLIDTGDEGASEKIKNVLSENGIKNIDLISISHYHTDHTGSIYDLVSLFSVDNLLFPPTFSDTNMQKNVLYAKERCLAEDGDFIVAKQGKSIKLGDFELIILYVPNQVNGENNRSVCMVAKIRNKKFLFTGDGERAEENLLLSSNINLSCDVLKVPHHGGSNSSTDDFLDAASPDYAVISCGKDNMYGHPHTETIDRLNKRRINTFITEKNGNVRFEIGEEKIGVNTDK